VARRPWLTASAAFVALLGSLLVVVWVTTPHAQHLETLLAARERATGVKAVPLSGVSVFVRESLVATEDERFYRNHGVDLLGIMRAIPYDASHASFAEGASTITDQLAKILYLNGNDHSPWRKLEDLDLSLQISTRYSKDQVLAAYLNSVYFGSGAYGVEAAANRYFGVRASQLDLNQGSLLAGLVQAPTAYDPLLHPQAARSRQIDVLRSLVRDGYATAKQATAVLARPLLLRGGRVLPALTGVAITPLPPFAWGLLAVGVGLIAVGLGGFVALRRSGGSAIHILGRLACTLVVFSGLITVSGSFRAL
jgi:membrane peptidoglycan carboxypeptidase